MRILMAAILLITIWGKPAISFKSLEARAQENTKTSASVAITAKDGYMSVNGIRIHYLEWGLSGLPIILLHGMSDDAKTWKDLAPMLACDYHVYAPDRRGSGDSDKSKEGYDFQTLVRDNALFIENLKLKPVILIGHSFGAEIALMMVVQRPDLIRSVVLVDGGFWPKRVAEGAAPSSEIEKTSSDYDPELIYPKVTTSVLLVFAHGKGPGPDILAELKRKGIDYLEQSRKAEQRAKELADRKLLHGETAFVENSSHWIQKDQPESLAQVIKQFLAKLGVIP